MGASDQRVRPFKKVVHLDPVVGASLPSWESLGGLALRLGWRVTSNRPLMCRKKIASLLLEWNLSLLSHGEDLEIWKNLIYFPLAWRVAWGLARSALISSRLGVDGHKQALTVARNTKVLLSPLNFVEKIEAVDNWVFQACTVRTLVALWRLVWEHAWVILLEHLRLGAMRVGYLLSLHPKLLVLVLALIEDRLKQVGVFLDVRLTLNLINFWIPL